MKNIGWWYLREYFGEKTYFDRVDQISTRDEDQRKKKITELLILKNESLFRQTLSVAKELPVNGTQTFTLETTYPGLIAGTGTAHEISQEGELKMGFSFDHTTGQPNIPGSSVKGLLRSPFPNQLRRQNSQRSEKDERLSLKADQKEAYLVATIEEVTGMTLNADELLQLEWAIFEGVTLTAFPKKNDGSPDFPKLDGKRLSVYEADIFHDAYLTAPVGKPFLGNDYITPHKHKDRSKKHLDALVNPTPLQFMKILPGVTFAFQFDLKPTTLGDRIFTVAHKTSLFRQILLDFGIGAKTNVGYGQLIDP